MGWSSALWTSAQRAPIAKDVVAESIQTYGVAPTCMEIKSLGRHDSNAGETLAVSSRRIAGATPPLAHSD